MTAARSVVEWCAFALLRVAATCSTAAGLAFLAAAGAVMAGSALATSSADWVRLLVGGSLGLAVVLLVAGGISLHLRRAPTPWLPDGPRSRASTGSGFDGWLILFPLTLIVVPSLMLFQLRPLADFWRDVFVLADQVNFWQDLQRNAAAGVSSGRARLMLGDMLQPEVISANGRKDQRAATTSRLAPSAAVSVTA